MNIYLHTCRQVPGCPPSGVRQPASLSWVRALGGSLLPNIGALLHRCSGTACQLTSHDATGIMACGTGTKWGCSSTWFCWSHQQDSLQDDKS